MKKKTTMSRAQKMVEDIMSEVMMRGEACKCGNPLAHHTITIKFGYCKCGGIIWSWTPLIEFAKPLTKAQEKRLDATFKKFGWN